jgi:hypothetical protein
MLNQIQSRTLEIGKPCAPSFVALCFHTLTNCFSRKPFVLTTIRIAPGCGGQIQELPPFFSVRSVSPWQMHSFHTIAASLSARKKSSALESGTSGLFFQNAGVGWASRMLLRDTQDGESIHDKNGFPPTLHNGFPNPRCQPFAPFQFQNHYLHEAALC